MDTEVKKYPVGTFLKDRVLKNTVFEIMQYTSYDIVEIEITFFNGTNKNKYRHANPLTWISDRDVYEVRKVLIEDKLIWIPM